MTKNSSDRFAQNAQNKKKIDILIRLDEFRIQSNTFLIDSKTEKKKRSLNLLKLFNMYIISIFTRSV